MRGWGRYTGRVADDSPPDNSRFLLAALQGWETLRFEGPDRKQFLNGLLTNDVANIKPFGRLPCCLLTPKGRLLADLDLYDRGEDLLAVCRTACAANLRRALGAKLILSQTRMTAETWELLLVLGEPAGKPLGAVLGLRPGSQVHQADRQGGRVWVLENYRAFGSGWLILAAPGLALELSRALLGSGSGRQMKSEEFLEAVRILERVPAYGKDMDAETLPQEARLDDHISYTKGCYMGQETMSRIKHLGHVNRILVRLDSTSEHIPPNGTVYAEGREIGKVTSGVRINALAMIRAEDNVVGRTVEVVGPEGRVAATIVDLLPAT